MVVSLYLLFEILSIVLCLHYLYGEKPRLEKITLSLILVEISWMLAIYYFHLEKFLALAIYPIIGIYCGVRFGLNLRKIFINSILYVMILGILQSTIMYFLYIFFNIKEITEKDSLIINIIIFVLTVAFLRRCQLNKLSEILLSNDKTILVSVIIVIASIVTCLVNYRNDKGLDIAYYIILFVSITLIFIIGIDIGKHKVKNKEMEAELRMHKLYENSFQKLIDDIRARQHEFDNHINTIYSQHYLYHTYEELVEVQKKYCTSIEKANKYNKLLSKGNSILLGFLYSKFAEAEELGIDVEYKVRVADVKSNVPIYKLIELIGNLLDNAIEALAMQEKYKKLKVIMIEQPYEIAIDISNECKNINIENIQKFFLKGYSEKGENRGYGLYNVKRICEDYNIVLETAIKNELGVDRLHFMLIINKPL